MLAVDGVKQQGRSDRMIVAAHDRPLVVIALGNALAEIDEELEHASADLCRKTRLLRESQRDVGQRSKGAERHGSLGSRLQRVDQERHGVVLARIGVDDDSGPRGRHLRPPAGEAVRP
jgi:hypothetical protein